MKKILFPIQTKKVSPLKTFIFPAFALFLFTAHSTFGQCCAKLTSTKTCRGKNTGTATVTPCTPGNYTFTWDDAFGQTGAVASGLTAGVYHVVMATSTFTCPALEVIVTDSSCTPFSVPNVMTPNGDGVNDYFAITGLESGTKLTVFNRWGEVVYSSNNYDNDWSAGNLTEGVYYYIVNRPSTETTTGKNDPSSGFVQIITGK